MTNIDPRSRLTLEEFQSCSYFKSGLMETMKFLQSLMEQSNIQKAKSLPAMLKVLPKFTLQTVQAKILPILLEELKNIAMIPFLLPSIFW